MKIEKTRLDSKGRAVIPKPFREALGLREGDPVFVSLNERNQAIMITQYSESAVYQLTICMGDAPGTLAKIATILFENGVDLIATESHSTLRTKGAVWRILCTINRKKTNFAKLKKLLLRNGANSLSFARI
jgi:AbrB family looped-hinge helix DNA binding protein